MGLIYIENALEWAWVQPGGTRRREPDRLMGLKLKIKNDELKI